MILTTAHRLLAAAASRPRIAPHTGALPVWSDDMETAQRWTKCADGADSILELSAAQAHGGSQSLHLLGRTIDAAAGDEVAAFKEFGWVPSHAVAYTGWIYLPAVAHLSILSFRSSAFDGNFGWQAQLAWDMTTGNAYIFDPAGTPVAVAALNHAWQVATWTQVRLSLDLADHHYISGGVAAANADLSATGCQALGASALRLYQLRTGPTTGDTDPAEMYLDDVTVTQTIP